MHVDADHVAAWCEPQLALARQQDVPGFMLLASDQGVLAVGAEPSARSRLAVFGPSARLEVPAAKGPNPFFAAFSNTWRSVNS
jgi:hypothetical protein